MKNADLSTLREILHDANVLAGRLSSQVSAQVLPATAAGEVEATRECILAAQHCAMLIQLAIERADRARLQDAQVGVRADIT